VRVFWLTVIPFLFLPVFAGSFDDAVEIAREYMKNRYNPVEMRIKKISSLRYSKKERSINETYLTVIWKRPGTKPFKKYLMVRIEKIPDRKASLVSVWERRDAKRVVITEKGEKR